MYVKIVPAGCIDGDHPLIFGLQGNNMTGRVNPGLEDNFIDEVDHVATSLYPFFRDSQGLHLLTTYHNLDGLTDRGNKYLCFCPLPGMAIKLTKELQEMMPGKIIEELKGAT